MAKLRKKTDVKMNKTICVDHDIIEIAKKINDQGGKLSPVVCQLLRFYRDNDYRIPVATMVIMDPDHPDFVEPVFTDRPGGEPAI